MLLELLPIYNLPLIKHTLAILLYCYILSDNISKLLIIQVYSQFPAFGSSTASPFGGVTPANPFATTAPSAFGASQGTSIFGSTPIENPSFGSQTGSSLFGGTTCVFGATQASQFGSSTPAFGASSAPLFGSGLNQRKTTLKYLPTSNIGN